MASFDLAASIARAERRLGDGPGHRRRRSDAGASRLPHQVEAHARSLMLGWARPPVKQLQGELRARCTRAGFSCPSRATLYTLMDRLDGHSYEISELPPEVRATLYNLPDTGSVPGRQLAFYCFNYGDTRALSFAAGLPWLDLHQAAKLRGWRPKSHGLLRAVLRARGM